MELALPFIALSGLYVISNQNNEKPDKKKITSYSHICKTLRLQFLSNFFLSGFSLI